VQESSPQNVMDTVGIKPTECSDTTPTDAWMRIDDNPHQKFMLDAPPLNMHVGFNSTVNSSGIQTQIGPLTQDLSKAKCDLQDLSAATIANHTSWCDKFWAHWGCFLLKQLVNQCLQQTCMPNVKLSFPKASTAIHYQPWHKRRVRRISHHTHWSFFTTMWPDLPTSVPKCLASCQPKSALNMCNQCQIVISVCTNCDLLTQNEGWKGALSPVLVIFCHAWPDLCTFPLQTLATCQPKSTPNTHNQCQIIISTCINCNLLSTLTWKKG